jgi:hypothetical protein
MMMMRRKGAEEEEEVADEVNAEVKCCREWFALVEWFGAL